MQLTLFTETYSLRGVSKQVIETTLALFVANDMQVNLVSIRKAVQ